MHPIQGRGVGPGEGGGIEILVVASGYSNQDIALAG